MEYIYFDSLLNITSYDQQEDTTKNFRGGQAKIFTYAITKSLKMRQI